MPMQCPKCCKLLLYPNYGCNCGGLAPSPGFCKLIDGAAIAATLRQEIRQEVADLKKNTGVIPQLVAIVVGVNPDPASMLYVNKKIEACEEVGIKARMLQTTFDALIPNLLELNNDSGVHGYILQLPLPNGVNATQYFNYFDVYKDVDVFHPENVGLLVQHRPRFKPCTPHGIQVMLHRSGIQVAGKRVVVINRSNVVGKPLSSMLIQECDEYANATVTVCHDHTPVEMLREITKQSEIVVVAVGKPGFLTAKMIRPGAVVIDVGITRVGKKVLGDVDFSVRNIAGWVSPVPGGCGPMTVCMLLENTLLAAKMSLGYNPTSF